MGRTAQPFLARKKEGAKHRERQTSSSSSSGRLRFLPLCAGEGKGAGRSRAPWGGVMRFSTIFSDFCFLDLKRLNFYPYDSFGT